jgi:hypothetical protein
VTGFFLFLAMANKDALLPRFDEPGERLMRYPPRIHGMPSAKFEDPMLSPDPRFMPQPPT